MRKIESCVLKPELWLLIHYSNGSEFTHEERKASHAEEFLCGIISKARNEAIEECAKVCEWRDTDLDPEDTEYNPDAWGWRAKDYARNIRYLKNKPAPETAVERDRLLAQNKRLREVLERALREEDSGDGISDTTIRMFRAALNEKE